MYLKRSYALLIGAIASVGAVKDDEYYRAGMGNPNVDLTMYWADAHNVLEDLDQFETLYIQYHNCAWSQNKNFNGDEEESGSADENDYWYIGATPTYAANVAYSLYGSLAGEKFAGCNSDTFINSFTTNQGFEAFAAAIYYAGSTSTDYSQSYSSECQGGSGIVCDYKSGFAYATFSSDVCDPANAQSVSDTMSYMNQAFQSAQCVQIYDASSNNYNNYGNRDLQKQENNDSKKEESGEEDRKLQNNYNYGDNGYNGANAYNGGYGSYGGYGYGSSSYMSNYYNYQGTALSILYYSDACFIQNYWAIDGGCPDPFGMLEEYQTNFNKGVRKSMKVDTYATYRANMATGKKYVKIGAFFFFAAVIMFISEQLMAFQAKKRAGGLKGASSGAKKSVVDLVSKTGGKIKRSASKGVKKAVAKVTKKSKAKGAPAKDGIMVEPAKK